MTLVVHTCIDHTVLVTHNDLQGLWARAPVGNSRGRDVRRRNPVTSSAELEPHRHILLLLVPFVLVSSTSFVDADIDLVQVCRARVPSLPLALRCLGGSLGMPADLWGHIGHSLPQGRSLVHLHTSDECTIVTYVRHHCRSQTHRYLCLWY